MAGRAERAPRRRRGADPGRAEPRSATGEVRLSGPGLGSVETMTTTQAFHGDVFAEARKNEDFRRVLATGRHTQLVIMTVPPGGEIGSEVHEGIDQVLIGIEGSGASVLDGVE